LLPVLVGAAQVMPPLLPLGPEAAELPVAIRCSLLGSRSLLPSFGIQAFLRDRARAARWANSASAAACAAEAVEE